MTKLRQPERATQVVRCAIYTRKSTDEGLEQEFNSLDAQRESGEAYIKSQASEGWECLPTRYDDGGFTGGNMDRPALQRMLADIESGKIDSIVVYKVDRLSRSLLDFAKMVETFDRYHVSFVSVTQLINTSTSMGRLMLNVLLSFAQFEREIISERTRDKMAAARRKGKWVGGRPILGYNVVATKLVVDPDEAERVRKIFSLYAERGGLVSVVQELNRRDWRTKQWTTRKENVCGGRPFNKNSLYDLLTNVAYIGKIKFKGEVFDGEHDGIVGPDLWQTVQSQLVRNGRTGGAMVRNKFGAILKGLLHCVPCGCAMCHSHSTKDGKKRYRYYVCSGAQKRGWQNCPSKSIPAGEIERFVVDQIKCIGRDPQLVAETVRQTHGQAKERLDELAVEGRRLARELAGYQRELQKLAQRMGSGNHGNAASQLADLQERIASTARRQDDIATESERWKKEMIDEADVAAALCKFDPVWESLNPREQGRLLQLLIERIDYDGRDCTISISFHASGFKALAEHEFAGDAA